MTPMQRSLRKLGGEGWMTAIVEKWNPWAKIRQDLWGFGDILCFRKDEVLIVQTTSAANVSARKEKILSLQSSSLWLESPSRKIVIHGWSKRGPRGKRKTWECRVLEITKSDSQQPTPPEIG